MTTGGTIEKTYDEVMGALSIEKTMLQSEILSQLRLPQVQIQVRPVMRKDSLDMTDQDRLLIYQSIRTFEERCDAIIVVHGTDTLVRTSEVCLEQISEQAPFKVPIVFTGAMIPMGFKRSDAHQNIIESIMATQFLSAGLFLSFHGQVFQLPHAKKNLQARTFEALSSHP